MNNTDGLTVFFDMLRVILILLPFLILFIVFLLVRRNVKRTTNECINIIKNDDESFDYNNFKQIVLKYLDDLNKSIINIDYEKLMNIETKDLFNEHKSKIELGIQKKMVNYDFILKTGDFSLIKCKNENGYIKVFCKILVTSKLIGFNPESRNINQLGNTITKSIVVEVIKKEKNKTHDGNYEWAINKITDYYSGIKNDI